MLYMNGHEVAIAVDQYRDHPILGPATRTLDNLVLAADNNSDGWAYWPKPSRAARQLMEMIGSRRLYLDNPERPDVDASRYRMALRPIKAFRTRTGLSFEIEEV